MKIALIEEPKSCASCPFLDMGYALDMCRLSKRQVTTMESINIPKWCELKPLPEEKNIQNVSINYFYDFGRAVGWNDCLDEIMGETE